MSKVRQQGYIGQTEVDFLPDTVSSSGVATAGSSQMVSLGSSFHRHKCAITVIWVHTDSHTHSVKAHISFHYTSSALYNNIRWGNSCILSQTISSGVSVLTSGSVCQVASFFVFGIPSVKANLIFWIKSGSFKWLEVQWCTVIILFWKPHVQNLVN